MSKEFGIIILAAGDSSRMGQSKQLLKVGNQTLLQKSIQTAINSGMEKIVVVLGSNDKAHLENIKDLPVKTVINEHWKSGMGSSIKSGLKSLMESHVDGVIVMVCDQPFVTSDHIKSLIATHRKKNKPLVAARYAKTFGVPALFTKKYLDQLLALGDNEGAKKIIMTHEKELGVLDLPEAAIDLDTVEDYRKFVANNSQ